MRRRPDIRVAERNLAAAAASVGVAVADLFPRVTVDAGIGLTAPRVSQLDDAGNDRRSFGPSLSWGLFDLGHTYQRIRAAGARNAEALANYEQTVLLALEDTENALSDYARERQRLEHLTLAAQASREAADLAGQRFEGGVSDFLDRARCLPHVARRRGPARRQPHARGHRAGGDLQGAGRRLGNRAAALSARSFQRKLRLKVTPYSRGGPGLPCSRPKKPIRLSLPLKYSSFVRLRP